MSAINARCGASQQSIAEGDPCRFVFISQSNGYAPIEVEAGDQTLSITSIASTTVYPNCFWRPESAFIRAVYDDYGLSKLVLETPLDRAQVVDFFGSLLNKNVKTKSGKNPFHDHPVDFQAHVANHAPHLHAMLAPREVDAPDREFDKTALDAELQACWHYLCELARRHRVFTYGPGRVVRPLEVYVMHERAYQGLVDHMATLKDWNDVSFEMGAYLRDAVDKGRAAADEARKTDIRPEMAFVHTVRDRVNAYDIASCFRSPTVRSAFDRDLHKVWADELTGDALATRYAKHMLDRCAIVCMEHFELKFSPMTYVGADFSNSLGTAYTKFITQVSEQVSADRKDWHER